MGLGHSPRIVIDGLVLALDAGNPKNYNAGISTNWVDKIGGNNGTPTNGAKHTDGPFVGAGRVDFDGTGDYLSIPNSADFRMGSDSFTIEGYLRNNSTVGEAGIVNLYGYTDNRRSYTVEFASGNLRFRTSNNGSASTTVFSYSGTPLAQWFHFAVVKSSTTGTLYINGTQVASGTADATLYDNTVDNLIIGNIGPYEDSYYLNGYISNLRIVKGTALYTSNFTPPTGPLTAVPNTVLLTCQGNTIADASSSAHTITANGDISLTKEPFAGAGAVAFDGSGDYLSIADSDDFYMDGDYTMECFVYMNDLSGSQVIFGQWIFGGGSDRNIDFFLSGSTLYFEQNRSGTNYSVTTTISANRWYHIAGVLNGTTLQLFIDGQSVGTTTVSGSPNNSTGPFGIGGYASGTAYEMHGYVSNVRVVKGTALYTSNFTPPSRTLEPIENTVLLTCQGQNIKDHSSSAHTITSNGNVKPTIVSSSFEFDGTNDYIGLPGNNIAFGTGQFSIEAWVYASSFVTNSNIFSSQSSNQAGFIGIGYNITPYTGFLIADYDGGLRIITINNTVVSLNTWYHLVGLKNSSNQYVLYVNGVASTTNNTSTTSLTATDPRIGINPASSAEIWNGRISNFRIYNRALTASEVQQNYNALKGRYV